MMACGELYLSIGTVIIDDIILPDGESSMARLGGGAVHAVMGMRLWSEHVGLAAPIGPDFANEHIEKLGTLFDLAGLLQRDMETPRCWQIFEVDGTRHEVFRTDLSKMIAALIQPDEYPEAYWNAKGIHLHCAVDEVPMWVKFLRSKGSPLILWEPWDPVMIPENREVFRRNAALVDIVSPNLNEGRLMTGEVEPHDVLRSLLGLDAKCVALRMGSMGSLIGDIDGRRIWVPGFAQGPVIDVTGAGNAYCGGFIVGLARTGDLLQAGCFGTVSSSFALQQFGAFYELADLHEEIESRFEAVIAKTPNPRRYAFDQMADEWDEMVKLQGDKSAIIGRIVFEGGVKSNDRVLDIGTGTGGMLSTVVKQKPKEIVAIDLSMRMLQKARQNHPVIAADIVRFSQADALLLPFENGAIDVIFCHGVFPHLYDFSVALKEFWRVLTPNGRLVISHAIGRNRVNAIHSRHHSTILRDDLLPAGNELRQVLLSGGWEVYACEDQEDLYLVAASKGAGSTLPE
jgi:sugar/nucleoside kinase (ribokinase family)/protein-L-isoaspartate O-methyltransferase